jgi:hypothetical protein
MTDTGWVSGTETAEYVNDGDKSWINPQYVLVSGEGLEARSGSANGTSTTLIIKGCDFSSIPNSAIILGIELKVRMRKANNGGFFRYPRLYLNNINIATKYFTQELTLELEDYVFGAPDDLWGASVTASDIKNPTFGGGGHGAYVRMVPYYFYAAVDYMALRITYEEGKLYPIPAFFRKA